MNKFLVFAVPVMAIGLLFSCTSDIESAEEVLKKAESSSSSDISSSSVGGLSSAGGSSSAVQGVSSGGSSQSVSVFCDFGGGDCREFSYEACLVFGQVVESCPGTAVSSSSSAPPSSGSLVPSSSSSSLSETVLCDFSDTCSPISADFCALLGGTPVQSCPVSSSSTPPSSSSLIVPSSSSVVPSSSSALPSSTSSLEPSSSSPVPSSSSVEPSSSSYGGLCAGFDGAKRLHYGKEKEQFCDERDGKKYVYVVIGTQTWMAENLNYNADGSKCYGDNSGGDSQNRCGTYGRLYNWNTATTVCPSGWHLPSDAEWTTLETTVGGSSTAGTKLKSASGWNDNGNDNGNGTDDYGFSTLPGGHGDGRSSFNYVGYGSDWWSATESNANAYSRGMGHTHSGVDRNDSTKPYLFYVRCVQD